MNKLTVKFNKSVIKIQEGNTISLTDLWKASGKGDSNNPYNWSRKEGSEFIAKLAKKLNTTEGLILKTTRGRTGGTWAHWQIGLAYAKYLSPELHMHMNQVFKERVEEDRNPELAYNRGTERAIKGWKRQGKSDEWISKWVANRIKGIEQRKVFTSTLSKHGVLGAGYGLCTNNIQEQIIGRSTQLAKQELGIKPSESIRDYIGNVENFGIALAEALAVESIEAKNYQGNGQCSVACLDAGNKISRAIRETRAIV